MNNYVKIRIIGKNPKLFIKRFLREKINYKNYKVINHQKIELKIDYSKYLEIKEKSSIYEIEVVRLYGPIRILDFIQKNFSFFISFLISIVFLFIINNIVFEIEVVHNNSTLRNLIYDELKEYGIKKYAFIPSFNKITDIKDKMVKNNKNKIEWIEIQKVGNKLIVKVTERKINHQNEDIAKRHIIAKKNGIILKIESEQGQIMKKTNDYVTEGEIIISGDIIKDDTVKGQVVSKGVVYAETWYKVNVEYPLYYEQTTYLNEVKNNIVIKFLSNEYSLKKNYTEAYKERKNTLVRSKIFPFEIRLEKQRKIKVQKQELTQKQAIKKARELAEKKLKSKLNNDEYIISKKTLNFYKKDSKIVVDVFFKVCENITEYIDVDESLLNKEEIKE